MIVLGALAIAGETTAQESNTVDSYHLLAPIPGLDEDYDLRDGDNAFSKYLNTMISIFIGICAVLSVVMIVIGGLEYMTSELVHSKEHGKERIRGALLGLLIALGAYAILYTINPNLLKSEVEIRKVKLEVDLNADVPQTPVGGKYANGIAKDADWNAIAGAIPGVQGLSWVTAKTPECVRVGQQGCTSTKGLGLGILLKINRGCPNCKLTVTGGTEFWLHGGETGSTSHQVGSSTVDLRITQELNQYITGGKPLEHMKRYEKDGVSYLYEGNHWHAGR